MSQNNMIEVGKGRFFEVVGPLSAHPRAERTHSSWEIRKTGEVIGRSEPGFMGGMLSPHRYWLTQKYAEGRA